MNKKAAFLHYINSKPVVLAYYYTDVNAYLPYTSQAAISGLSSISTSYPAFTDKVFEFDTLPDGTYQVSLNDVFTGTFTLSSTETFITKWTLDSAVTNVYATTSKIRFTGTAKKSSGMVEDPSTGGFIQKSYTQYANKKIVSIEIKQV